MTSTQMRAAVLTAHGSPLQIGPVSRPEAAEGEVLVRVKASAQLQGLWKNAPIFVNDLSEMSWK